MTNLRLALAAALLTGAALPAFAADTQPATDAAAATTSQMPAQNNAQAGQSDMGNNAAPNMQAQSNGSAGSQTAMNSADGSMGISSAASPTQRKGTHLSAAQRAKADAAEAETTRQLNQEAAAMAAPNRTAMR
jgi:hypothetical protein